MTKPTASVAWISNLGTFSALRVKPFRNFWSGLLAIYFGVQVQSLAAAWLAYELTRSPFKLGLVAAAWALPVVLFSVFGGVVADRAPKRTVLIWSRLWISLVTCAVAVLIATGLIEYWHLVAAGVFLGFGYAFSMAANQAIIPELVPPELTFNAIALNNSGFNLSRVAGPALAGVLIGTFGTAGAYFTATVFYLIAIGVLWTLPKTGYKTAGRGPLIEFMAEGLKYIWEHRPVIIIMALEFVLLFIAMPFQNFMPAFAERLNVQAVGYGFLVTMLGVGAMVGSLGVASLGNFKRKGWLLLSSGVVYGATIAVFAILQSFSAAMVFLVLVGLSGAAYLATSNTLIQMNVTDVVRGRVMSVYLTISGLQPLGVMLIGAIAEFIGVATAVAIGGGIIFVLMLVMLFALDSVRQLK